MASPPDVLDIDPDADDEEVERAYRERIKEAHPDRGGSVEEFIAVRRAYEAFLAGEWESMPAGEDDGRTDEDARYRRATSTVRYLNYDVLADFGWDVDDPDLFEMAAAAGLDDEDYGEFEVDPGETLLEAAEDEGLVWPFACRGGACANCAILLRSGELSMPVSHVLPAEMMERGFRLSCNAMPITDELEVVFNVKHMPVLEELLLPPGPFEHAYPDD